MLNQALLCGIRKISSEIVLSLLIHIEMAAAKQAVMTAALLKNFC